MQRTSCGVECARVDKSEATLPGSNHSQLREPDVIADGHSNTAIVGQIHQRHAVTRRQHIALFELDLAWDIDIEQMHLAMRRKQLAVRAEDQAGVVVRLLVLGALLNRKLGNRSAHQVNPVVARHGGKRVEGRALLGSRGRREKLLRVRGEEVTPVGGVEALGKNDNVGAARSGLAHLVSGVRKVGGLVGAAGELDASELDGLLEQNRVLGGGSHLADLSTEKLAGGGRKGRKWLVVVESRALRSAETCDEGDGEDS